MLNLFAHASEPVTDNEVQPMMDWHHWSAYGGFAIFWLLLVLALIGLAVWLVVGSKNNVTQDEDPLKILKTRYAKGEISKKQYQEMKKELSEK